MPHASDEQLRAGVGPFGRFVVRAYLTLFVLAMPVTIVGFIIYAVKYG